MPCYEPKQAYRIYWPEYGHTSTSFRIIPSHASTTEPIQFPCRKCIGCRLAHAKSWTIRILHEMQTTDETSGLGSTFITLTYADEHLPANGSIDTRTLQLFLKRLRRAIEPLKIRHYSVGEYGDQYARPHYHAAIFGYEFPDREPFKYNPETHSWTYTSPLLSTCWPYGFVTIQTLNSGNAAYIARYVTKKLTGPKTELYEGKKPEFSLKSLHPGLGHDWIIKYKNDVYPSDVIIHQGKHYPIPSYYDKVIAEIDPATIEESKDWRSYEATQHTSDLTPERLAIRETIQRLKQERYTRTFENGN